MSESPQNVSIDCEFLANRRNKRRILRKGKNEFLFRAAKFIFQISEGSYGIFKNRFCESHTLLKCKLMNPLSQYKCSSKKVFLKIFFNIVTLHEVMMCFN
jgi:hypothetical protein